jgi:outer membrane protein
MAMRTTNIPFDTDARTVATLVPLIMFENKYVFFREIEGGVHLLNRPDWELNLLARMHFFDIPVDFQNQVQGDNLDWGIQGLWKPWQHWVVAADVSTDFSDRPSANLLAHYNRTFRRGFARVGFRGKFKTADYNSTYWGLDRQRVDAGLELGGWVKLTYDVWRNFYVTGAASLTYLDKPVRDIEFVVDDWKWEGYAGLGLSDPMDKPRKLRMPENGYLRLGHMWATPSSLSHILHGEAEKDPDNHQMTTLFYGHPLTDRMFGLPLEFFLHSGLGLHWKSPKQNYEMEAILSIKMYYTIPLPWRIRVGAAEGLSWVTAVPYREEQNLSEKGYTTSQLLNYLDFSVDLNLGDITPGDALDKLWLGYYIHHRSAIFKSAQQFGRIKGGSNFQAVYLQHHF